jgi:hypothetical protein
MAGAQRQRPCEMDAPCSLKTDAPDSPQSKVNPPCASIPVVSWLVVLSETVSSFPETSVGVGRTRDPQMSPQTSEIKDTHQQNKGCVLH